MFLNFQCYYWRKTGSCLLAPCLYSTTDFYSAFVILFSLIFHLIWAQFGHLNSYISSLAPILCERNVLNDSLFLLLSNCQNSRFIRDSIIHSWYWDSRPVDVSNFWSTWNPAFEQFGPLKSPPGSNLSDFIAASARILKKSYSFHLLAPCLGLQALIWFELECYRY